MKNRKDFCNEIIDLINEKPSELVFFTGAGISCDPPSSLPLANEVKLALIDAICKEGKKTSINQFYKYYQKKIEEYLKNILMESVFEIIRLRSEELDVIKMIKKIFSTEKTNRNHIFLSRLLKKGCNVITSNFDILIEKASNFKKKILHLHGLLDDSEYPESLIATLNRVGQGLSKELWERLEKALKNKIVIFIGWSDNDIDITPILFLSDIKRVYWIDHKKEKTKYKIVHYYDNEVKKPEDPVDELIKQFEGTKYIGNTDTIVDAIWQGLCGCKLKPSGKRRNKKWEKPIKDLESLEEWDRALIFLEVLERIDPEKKLPLKLIEKLEKDIKRQKDLSLFHKLIFYELSCKKSVCNRIISNYEEAIKSAEKAVEMIKTDLAGLVLLKEEEWLIKSFLIELRNDIASAYNDWGYIEGEKGDCRKAIERHKKAIKIFKENIRELSNELDKLRGLTNEDRLKILILLDNAQVHTNLGSTYLGLYETGSRCSKPSNFLDELLNKAEENYLEGIKIHEGLKKKLRDKKFQDALREYNNIKLADLYNNIANVYSQKSGKDKAENYYKKCYVLKKECGDVRGMKRLVGDYLFFLENNNLKPKNLKTMCAESKALKFAFAEETISSTHLLYYKKKLSTKQLT